MLARARTDACRLDSRPCADLAGRGSGGRLCQPGGSHGTPQRDGGPFTVSKKIKKIKQIQKNERKAFWTLAVTSQCRICPVLLCTPQPSGELRALLPLSRSYLCGGMRAAQALKDDADVH